ncbi:hypothetical protein F4780DRAFT_134947 [Xylariomycetidae sp. FL0641]|nr:hypothetical protein F4780DRAFT_134947 [Xylariomycetidae sp. FL0641]
MASNPYEVEHNLKTTAERSHQRRPDMSTFTSHLHSITREPPASADAHHHDHHPGPTPVDMAALFQQVQEQMATLATSAPTDGNRAFLRSLVELLEADIGAPPEQIPGVGQAYLDGLDRVPRRALKDDDACPICAEPFLDDQYCLVVELPCHGAHRFDLECVGPWLLSKGSCPMCRKDLTKKKEVVVPKDDSEDEDDVDGLYG